jgi:hypothetical protein
VSARASIAVAELSSPGLDLRRRLLIVPRENANSAFYARFAVTMTDSTAAASPGFRSSVPGTSESRSSALYRNRSSRIRTRVHRGP